jgi:hypothetical protein
MTGNGARSRNKTFSAGWAWHHQDIDRVRTASLLCVLLLVCKGVCPAYMGFPFQLNHSELLIV